MDPSVKKTSSSAASSASTGPSGAGSGTLRDSGSTPPPGFFERTSAKTHSISNVGSYMFDNEADRERKFAEERLEAGTVATFAQSKAHTPIDGLAKGVAALGTGLGKGLLGVFTEPIKGASEGGTTGFFSGLGRGLVGLVARPTAGVIELGVKTTEGFANTPSTLSNLVSGNSELLCFGSPLKASLDLAKANKQRHLIVKCLDELEHSGLDKKGVFTTIPNEGLVLKFRDSFNQNQDVNLEAIDPHIIACLFKLYLLELPVPLITPAVFDELIAIGRTAATGSSSGTSADEESIKKIKAHLSQLPDENKAVLSEICVVLRKFLKSASRNGLDLSTLASSISLCLLRPSNYSLANEPTAEGGYLNSLIQFSKTEQIPAADKRAIQYLTKQIIMNYQPGYLTYNLYG
jgi:hypothetical protein